jgi:hypothetical protein
VGLVGASPRQSFDLRAGVHGRCQAGTTPERLRDRAPGALRDETLRSVTSLDDEARATVISRRFRVTTQGAPGSDVGQIRRRCDGFAAERKVRGAIERRVRRERRLGWSGFRRRTRSSPVSAILASEPRRPARSRSDRDSPQHGSAPSATRMAATELTGPGTRIRCPTVARAARILGSSASPVKTEPVPG